MAHAVSSYLSPHDVIRILRENPRRWIVPAVAVALVASAYAIFRSSTWEASQALVIREEVSVDQQHQGKFSDLNEMKTVQETIMELARSKSVLQATLTAVGAPAGEASAKYPTDRDVADLRESVKLTPPNGAEFGKTEVFYLKVKDHSRPRAIALANELCNQLQRGFQALRDTKMESVTDELGRAVQLADADLQEATDKLGKLESEVGVDLAELRMLHASSTAGSNLRQELVEVQNEIRTFETEKRRNEQLLEVLAAAGQDPARLLATPNSLLAALPAVRRLKDGLVDAQLETSRLAGVMSSDHPVVKSAQAAEIEIGNDLQDELSLAVKGLEVEVRMTGDRIATLKAQLAKDEQRLQRLAGLRAEYANLVSMTENRTELLETARRSLSDARAGRAAASSVNLISRIDTPDAGINPIGPSRASIGAAGLLGGLMIGFGFVFLTTPPFTPAPAATTVTAATTATPAPATIESEDSYEQLWQETEELLDSRSSLSFTEAMKKFHRQLAVGSGASA